MLTLGFGAANAAIGVTEGIFGEFIPFDLPLFNPVSAFFSSLAGVYVAWLLWALVTWLIGEYVFKGDAGPVISHFYCMKRRDIDTIALHR